MADNKEEKPASPDTVATAAASVAAATGMASSLNPGPAIEVALEAKAGDVLANGGTSASLAPSLSNAPSTPEPVTTRGEHWYNKIVYQGINYWLNLGISLVIADYFQNLKGAKHLEGLATKMTGKNAKAQRSVKVGLEQLSLNSGGWLLLIPSTIMENHKRGIVHWLNKKLGVNQKAPDGHEMEADEIYIEQEQPHQTALRALGRRTLASGSTILGGMALDRAFQKNLDAPRIIKGKGVTTVGGKQRLEDTIVHYADKGLRSVGGSKIADKDWVKRYLNLASLDIINTYITATVMYLTNGAGKGKTPKEIDHEDAPLVDDKSVNTLRYLSAREDRKYFEDEALKKSPARTPAAIAAKKTEEGFAAAIQKQNETPSEPGLST